MSWPGWRFTGIVVSRYVRRQKEVKMVPECQKQFNIANT